MNASRRGRGPVTDRRERGLWRRVLQPCLGGCLQRRLQQCLPLGVLFLFTIVGAVPLRAQTVTSEMLRPEQGTTTAPTDSALRKTPSVSGVLPNPGGPVSRPLQSGAPTAPEDRPASSRINRLQTFDVPAASGAGTTGFDTLNRRRARAKPRPGAPRPKTLPGASQKSPSIYVQPPPPAPTFSASVPTVTSTAAPSQLSAPPLPSATARTPVSQSVAGTYPGAPLRRRLRPEEDPFGAVGVTAGSFVLRPAIEFTGGYDTNPSRTAPSRGSAFYAISPELLAASNWSRHSLTADLRGTFTGYKVSGEPIPSSGSTVTPAPLDIDRPDFNGRVNGRYDVVRDTRLVGEGRARVSTDNPGSPNIQFGLAKYPLFLTTGATLGIEQDFNRFQIQLNGLADRTQFQNSRLTDGSSSSNNDRNFDQYGGLLRLSYDLLPGVKPFGEAQADTRIRDQRVDRFGFARSSDGTTVRAGSTFEFSRLLIGEASIGYAKRTYEDPRLNDLTGLLTRASLTWFATPLTTVRLLADSSVDESQLSGVSGVLTRTYTLQVDHDFRRWLTGIGKFTAGTIDYQGGTRSDVFYSASANVLYKLNRELWLKGEVRHDWLDSNLPGLSTRATVVLLGVRLQR